MARQFAVDTDQLLTSSLVFPVVMSAYVWAQNPTTASNSPRWFDHAPGGDLVALNGSSPQFAFLRGWSGGTGDWRVTTSLPTWANWNHFALTYDGSLAANNPILYINAVARSNDTTTSPSGTINTTSGAMTIGNTPGGFRNLGGAMAYFGLHNVVLTPAEINEAMLCGSVARGLIGLWNITGASPELDTSGAGHDAVVTGTTIVASPAVPCFGTQNLAPVIYGRGAA